MRLFETEHPFVTGQDISSADFWGKPFVERDETFAWLRRHAPVSWHPPLEALGGTSANRDQAGLWAVTLAEDIHHVSQHHDIFSQALGVRPSDRRNNPGVNFMGMDPPEHTRRRNVFSSLFTPKGVTRLQAKIEERSEQIVDAVVGAGDFDFVTDVSSKLPMLTVADLVGIPESQVEAFTRAGNNVMTVAAAGADLPEGVDPTEFLNEQMAVFSEIGLDVTRHRREHPAHDVATSMAMAEIDGKPMTDGDIVMVLMLLSAAGNDTTRHTTSWTALNLCQKPDQRSWLLDDFEGRIGQAVEEFIRYATVVITFSRTATCDTELRGQKIAAGDRVAMFYCSGNRDERLFPDPNRFDVTRPRTNHVAFGGRGVHYCLGNVVARAQLRALFRQILTKLPDLQVAGSPEFLHSNFINGIKRLPVRS